MSWIHCLASSKPSIVTDVASRVDIASLDPRDWRVREVQQTPENSDDSSSSLSAAMVSIDILDEAHSLKLAMNRLISDRYLRAALSTNAKKLWAQRFTLDKMVRGYKTAIEKAIMVELSDLVRPDLPAHFRVDGTERTGELLQEFGVQGKTDLTLSNSDSPKQK